MGELTLSENIQQNLPHSIVLPEQLIILLDYIDVADINYFKTNILFYPVERRVLAAYFDVENENLLDSIGLIGTTGDGSLLGIWKNEKSFQFIHLGSEGNNWLVLAENVVDFIRLLGIGYGYFGPEEIDLPPKYTNMDTDTQNWIEKTFDISIPTTGKDIVNKKSELFNLWPFS